jgi:hypothetical protein
MNIGFSDAVLGQPQIDRPDCIIKNRLSVIAGDQHDLPMRRQRRSAYRSD